MIRPATISDLPDVLTMLKSFARASLIDYTTWTDRDEASATQRLHHMIVREYLMVAEHHGQLVGMIGAVQESDPWLRSRIRMREMFWWVEPGFRRKRISAELFIRWQQDCEQWISENRFYEVCLSTQPGSSDIDLSGRGWRCVEHHWIKG